MDQSQDGNCRGPNSHPHVHAYNVPQTPFSLSDVPPAGWGHLYEESLLEPVAPQPYAIYSYPPEAYEIAAAIAWPDTPEVDCNTSSNEQPTVVDNPAQLPDPVGQTVVAQRRIRASPVNSFDCGSSCAKNIAGPHKCFRNGLSLIVQCNTQNCSRVFKNKNDFNRHFASVHGGASEARAVKLFDCPVAGCPRVGRQGFKRRDNMLQHRRGVHGEEIAKVRFRFA